jgi:hypothetical protein
LEGVYRGFSIGGQPELVRGSDIIKFRWLETSLVDRPADPDALFTVVRAEGVLDAEYDVRILEEGEEYVVEDLTRGLTSGEVPTRENLEGGKKDGKKTPVQRQEALKANIEDLRQALLNADDGSDTQPLIERAVKAAQDALKDADLSVEIERGTGSSISPKEICDHLLSLYNSNNDDEPGIQSAIDAANAALKGDVERADGPLREAYSWFPEQAQAMQVASFKDRTGGVLNETLAQAFSQALYRFMDTMMEAPDLAARHQNVADFAQFLNVWLNHDAAMRSELARGEGLPESEGEDTLPFATLIENLRASLTRGEEAESLAAPVSLERFESLQNELSTVQAEAQATLTRVELAEGNVSRLEGELVERGEQIELLRTDITQRDTEIAVLRKQPLKHEAPVAFTDALLPGALARSHPANDTSQDPAANALEALRIKRDKAQNAAISEPDVVKRGELVTEWMSLDAQLRTALLQLQS